MKFFILILGVLVCTISLPLFAGNFLVTETASYTDIVTKPYLFDDKESRINAVHKYGRGLVYQPGELTSLLGGYLSSDYEVTYSEIKIIKHTTVLEPTFVAILSLSSTLSQGEETVYEQNKDLVKVGIVNGVILTPKIYEAGTFSTTINGIDGFETKHVIGTKLGPLTGFSGLNFGRYQLESKETITHKYNAVDDSDLLKAAKWIDNLEEEGVINTIKQWLPNKSKNSKKGTKTIKVPTSAIGRRASVSFEGTVVRTASPAWVTYEIMLPEANTISVPISFGENKNGATLEVFLNDSPILSVLGDDYVIDQLSLLELNIAGLGGSIVELKFILNASGSNSAEIFISDKVLTSPAPILSPGFMPTILNYLLEL